MFTDEDFEEYDEDEYEEYLEEIGYYLCGSDRL